MVDPRDDVCKDEEPTVKTNPDEEITVPAKNKYHRLSELSVEPDVTTSLLADLVHVEQEEHAEDPIELFRLQYDLSEEDMADLIAHLQLCEETNTEIRWDLINRIIYPDDHLSLPMPEAIQKEVIDDADGDHEVPHEGIKDEFEESCGEASDFSGFSIYPESDDCASSVTFMTEGGEEIKSRKKQTRHSKEFFRADRLEDAAHPPIHLSPPPEIQASRRLSAIRASALLAKSAVANKNSINRPDPLLRKRVSLLQESRHASNRNLRLPPKAPTRVKSDLPHIPHYPDNFQGKPDTAWMSGAERSNLMDIFASMDPSTCDLKGNEPPAALDHDDSTNRDLHDVPSVFEDDSVPL